MEKCVKIAQKIFLNWKSNIFITFDLLIIFAYELFFAKRQKPEKHEQREKNERKKILREKIKRVIYDDS